MQKKQRNILITGSAGFIGKNLVNTLRNGNDRLTCLIAPWENFSFNDKQIEEVKGDVKNKKTISEIAKDKDVIFHLAAKTDFSGKTYEEYKEINVTATVNLAQEALKNGFKKFIFTSSIAAQGIKYETPFLDEKTENVPNNLYGKSKCEAEKKLLELHRNFNLPVVIIRPTTVYGPWEQSVFLALCKAINGEKYFQIGNGQNLVSYVYVKNLIKCLLSASEKEKANGQIFTVSDLYPYSMNYLTEAISKSLKKDKKLAHIPVSLGLTIGVLMEAIGFITGKKMPLYRSRVKNLSSSYTYDISKSIRELEYFPDFTLEEGINETINWYKKNNLL